MKTSVNLYEAGVESDEDRGWRGVDPEVRHSIDDEDDEVRESLRNDGGREARKGGLRKSES